MPRKPEKNAENFFKAIIGKIKNKSNKTFKGIIVETTKESFTAYLKRTFTENILKETAADIFKAPLTDEFTKNLTV